MVKRLDETNKAIIKLLRDGRRAFSSIALELGITENTVRSRVNKLIEDGILDIVGLVDSNKVPGFQVVVMGVKLKTMQLERKAKEFSTLKGVVNAMVVTGRYDLMIELEICEDDGFTLLDFFKFELVKIPEILEVETFVVYQSEGLKVPYLL